MYKIMLVDDKLSNNQSLEILIETYLDKKNIDYDLVEIVSVDSGTSAIKKVFQEEDYDLIFLDLMMPRMSGMDVLEIIRSANLPKKPKIVICTALNDYDVRMEAQLKQANAYITKPVASYMVESMLDAYMCEKIKTSDIENVNTSNEEEYFDDDFFDFDEEEDTACNYKDSTTEYNTSHPTLSAKEFLEDVDNLEHIIEDTAEIENDLERIISNLDINTLERDSVLISECLGKYASMLNGFVEFFELSVALRSLSNIVVEVDFSYNMPENYKENIIRFIKAILQDISNWRDMVFVQQTAIDVYYLNASALSSCIQLRNMIKESYEL
jgi:CheY-like chemotaxis protein